MSKRLSLLPKSLHLDFSKLEVKKEDEPLEKKPKLELGTKSDNMTLCFDWDGTMVKGSMHKYLRDIQSFIAHTKFADQFLADGIKDWKNKAQLVKLLTTESDLECHVDQFLKDETKSWKNKKQLETLLTKASDLGCHIAIVSFGSYPKEIKYALTKLDLEAISEKIHVVSYLLDENEMRCTGKQNHIKEAMKHFEVCDNERVVLIDDNLNNVDKALNDNMGAIHVGKNDTKYLDQAFKILNEEVPTQKATNQPSEYTVSQDSLAQSTSPIDRLGLSGELSSDSDITL